MKLVAGFALCKPKDLFHEYLKNGGITDFRYSRMWKAAVDLVGTKHSGKVFSKNTFDK